MLQMRMHSYEFEILPPAFGGGQNDIFQQARHLSIILDEKEFLKKGVICV